MITHWRSNFANSSLPFVFVLLAPDEKANAVADIRTAQLDALRSDYIELQFNFNSISFELIRHICDQPAADGGGQRDG